MAKQKENLTDEMCTNTIAALQHMNSENFPPHITLCYLVINTGASLTQKGQKCKRLMIRNSKSQGIPLALRYFPQHNICSKGRQSPSTEGNAREKAWMAAGVSRALSEPGRPQRKPAPLPQLQVFFKGTQAVLKGRGSNPAQENCLKSH